MKKFFAIICLFAVLILSACNNQIDKKNDTTILSGSQNFETTTILSKPETKINSNTLNEISTTHSSSQKEEKTTNIPSTTSGVSIQDVNEVPPYILTLNLVDLKQIKSASETMNESEFSQFMDENFANEVMNGMDTLEKAKTFLLELEETYIPLLDGDKNNFSTVSFYWERNEIYQLICFDDQTRLAAYVYTPKSSREKKLQLGEDLNIITVQTIETEKYIANLYEVENANYSFFADMIVDDTYVIFKGKPDRSFEEFKTAFERLEFVKIGDLLAE